MTLTPIGSEVSVSLKRVAVTTVSGSSLEAAVWAWEGSAARTASGSAARGARKMQFFMLKKQETKLSPPSPTVPERHGGAPVVRRTTTLLAGIRADRTTFIAFPDGNVPLGHALQWLRDESGVA
ncbi:hypothetical protein D9M69_675260 [compost metagenome]